MEVSGKSSTQKKTGWLKKKKERERERKEQHHQRHKGRNDDVSVRSSKRPAWLKH